MTALSVFARPVRRRDLRVAATIALVVACWARDVDDAESAEVQQLAQRLRAIANAPAPQPVEGARA